MFNVSPIAASMMIEPNTASGIDVAMMIVERQLPVRYLGVSAVEDLPAEEAVAA